MYVFEGVVVFLAALLVLRALIVWSRKYGPIRRTAEAMIGYFLLPAIVGCMVTGIMLLLSDIRRGTSLAEAGSAIAAIAVGYAIWRGLDALPGRRPREPRTSGPDSDHPQGPGKTKAVLDRAA